MIGDDSQDRRASAGDSPARRAEVSAWLRAAVERHQGGDFEQARQGYERILAAVPAHADAMQYYGILCQQCGDAQRAESLIRGAIAVRADVAAYHDNLGTVLEHRGRFEAALAAYREAERLEPGIAERACNVGLVLERLGRHAQAERQYRDAVERHPHDVECRMALARLLRKNGDSHGAVQALRQILHLDESHVAARINLGNALQEQGQFETALDEYRRVIARHPGNAEAHHNLGRALASTQQYAAAQQSFEQVLRLDPGHPEAALGIARTLERRGLLDRAYAAFHALCTDDTGTDEDLLSRARSGLLRVARVLPVARRDAVLVGVMLSAIEAGEVIAADFTRALGTQLAAKAGLFDGECTDDADALRRAIALERDPLFVATLERCVNIVPEVERWLCAVRRALLHASAEQLMGREPLLRVLALQCTANEYVFAVCDDEVGVIDAVLAQLAPQTAIGLLATDDNIRDLLLCACYGSLRQLWGTESLADTDSDTLGPWLAPIVQRTVIEPRRERVLAADLEALAPIAAPASQLVRAQYEEHPYPRWRELPPGAALDPALADSIGGRLVAAAIATDPQLPFLVAGCGTGFEPLVLARQYPDRPIVAIDLSRASLAYATRMAETLGIDRVRFVHGDLLDVGRLGCRFAVITASGVLHHLADPLAGWRALSACLQQGGIMKVALYSKRARSAINAARERVSALGLSADAQGVRTLRARVLAGEEPTLVALLDSEDFYTTSMCRDLIFHPLEHQFDVHEVPAMLDTLDLRFEGFDLPHPLIRQQFLDSRLGDETDLLAWSRFEAQHPRTFEGMYVMWCRKK